MYIILESYNEEMVEFLNDLFKSNKSITNCNLPMSDFKQFKSINGTIEGFRPCPDSGKPEIYFNSDDPDFFVDKIYSLLSPLYDGTAVISYKYTASGFGVSVCLPDGKVKFSVTEYLWDSLVLHHCKEMGELEELFNDEPADGGFQDQNEFRYDEIKDKYPDCMHEGRRELRDFIQDKFVFDQINEYIQERLNDNELAEKIHDRSILPTLTADITMQDSDGDSVLMVACREGNIDVVKLLIDAGADITLQDSGGDSALMDACRSGDIDIVKLLIDAGADINLQNSDGYSALMITCYAGNIDTVKLLIDAGADITLQNSDASSALMIACDAGNLDTVKLLIDTGADINLQNSDGDSALMDACEEGYIDTVKLLIDAGADINLQNSDGYSALMYACDECNIDTVKLLIDAGADKSIKDNEGNTALDCAEKEENEFVINLLK